MTPSQPARPTLAPRSLPSPWPPAVPAVVFTGSHRQSRPLPHSKPRLSVLCANSSRAAGRVTSMPRPASTQQRPVERAEGKLLHAPLVSWILFLHFILGPSRREDGGVGGQPGKDAKGDRYKQSHVVAAQWLAMTLPPGLHVSASARSQPPRKPAR